MTISGIAKVYGDLIIKKKRTYASCPKALKPQIEAYLESKGYDTNGNYTGGTADGNV